MMGEAVQAERGRTFSVPTAQSTVLLVALAFLFSSTLPPEVGRKLIDETRPASELSIVPFFERDRPANLETPLLKFEVATGHPIAAEPNQPKQF